MIIYLKEKHRNVILGAAPECLICEMVSDNWEKVLMYGNDGTKAYRWKIDTDALPIDDDTLIKHIQKMKRVSVFLKH